MGKWIEVARTEELADGVMKAVSLGSNEILLARVEGRYYAINNRCPHMGAKLSDGKLEGKIVTCPRHGSQFNVSNGSVVRWLKSGGPIAAVGRLIRPARAVTIYPVKQEGDGILIEIQTSP